MNGRQIVFLGMGGTIAGSAASPGDNVAYTAAQIAVQALLGGVAGLDTVLDGREAVAEQVAQIDSKDMDLVHWLGLAGRVARWLAEPRVDGIVITHGTDTLEETAYFLQATLSPAKPVVLACAMRPATSLQSDGPRNLRDAVAVALTPGARGVVAVCAGEVHGALDVQKVHTYRLDAFGSGDAGPLGYVEEGVLRRLREWPDSAPFPLPVKRLPPAGNWPRVEIVMSHAGASGAVVDALLASPYPPQGIVVAATGNGTIHHALQDALRRAQARGVSVVRASRCPQGRIMATGADDMADSGGLPAPKARVALMLELLASG